MILDPEAGFIQFARERLGLTLQDHQRAQLRRTIDGACRHFGYPSPAHYLEALRRGPQSSPELDHLIAGITVAESYFFRDRAQHDFLRDRWLPRVIAAKRRSGDTTLRIWSAGCARGEEAYTLAMILQENLPAETEWNISIFGTDICTQALTQAIRGHFRPWSLRGLPPALLEKYFVADRDAFRIDAVLRRLVRFHPLNLATDLFPSDLTQIHDFDLIVCRNVFIYLSRDVIAAITAKFAACLAPDGILLLGASDPIETGGAPLTLDRDGEIHVLRRHDSTQAAVPTRATARVKPPPSTTTPAPTSSRPVAPPTAVPQDASAIASLLDQKCWDAALLAADTHLATFGEQALILEYRAKALAHLGRPHEAAEACARSLALSPTRSGMQFLHGLVLIELGRLNAAEAALHKALFLDRGLVEAHVQLGLLRLRAGHRRAGLQSLRNALALARDRDPEAHLAAIPDMTYGQFRQALERDMPFYAALGVRSDSKMEIAR